MPTQEAAEEYCPMKGEGAKREGLRALERSARREAPPHYFALRLVTFGAAFGGRGVKKPTFERNG
jgi:hypothetical protein